MPIYAWQCNSCRRESEGYIPAWNDPNPPCECGGTQERIWRVTRHHAASVFPYVTSNITGSPIEITSESHLQSVCKAAGVTPRPDAAWIEKSLEATSKGPKWHEGSGRGMPGCW